MTNPSNNEEYETAMAEEHGPRDDMESADVARAMVFVALCWAFALFAGYGIWERVTG